MSTTDPKITTTEWDDLQIKYGNYAPRPTEITEDELTNIAIDFAEGADPLSVKTLHQLDELEDEVDEDDLSKYRENRLREMKERLSKAKYGEIYQLYKERYLDDINEASKQCWVVALLYKDDNPLCNMVLTAMTAIAAENRHVKFMKGIAQNLVEKFPEKNVPTLLLYRDGVCKSQIGPTELSANRAQETKGLLRGALRKHDIIYAPDSDGEDDRRVKNKFLMRHNEDESDDEQRDDRGYMNLKLNNRKF
eukprot:GHVO01012877.1.p1 GENE.GHVO01012877.1~~GHVO01012877.1.p1  ORF type:complete len:250 (-),score=66.87 GHVO01012877.1:278-1027(-)